MRLDAGGGLALHTHTLPYPATFRVFIPFLSLLSNVSVRNDFSRMEQKRKRNRTDKVLSIYAEEGNKSTCTTEHLDE
jgi:hypothetical protein